MEQSFCCCLRILYRQTSAVTESPATTKTPSITMTDAEAIRQSALELGARAASWQLSHLDNFDYIPERNREKTADALFMAPRTWLKLSNATGDPRYFDYGDSEYWATADYLFSDDVAICSV
jgi:rhamnogalacturonyl hydrolase YesR